jgi:hypothetical protein
METARNRPGMQAVPTTLAGVRQMIKALRRGEAVGLLPDQVPPEGRECGRRSLAQPAYTMTLAARLAQQTGATVLLARCERCPGAGFCDVSSPCRAARATWRPPCADQPRPWSMSFASAPSSTCGATAATSSRAPKPQPEAWHERPPWVCG